MIDVAQDREGLRRAAQELMEEVRAQTQREDGSTISPASETRRTLSPGYYLLLCRVQNEADEQLGAGIPYSEISFDKDDLLAWSILAEICAQFVRENPACSICGAPLSDWRDGMCAGCKMATATSNGRVN
jgi:hypothetical protein